MNKLACIVILLCANFAHAATIEQPLPNAAQEQTARHIFTELRCVVCEGQSVAESDASLAGEMRQHVRRLVAAGESEPAILAEFRADYGDRILLTPPLESSTAPLWLAPLLLLLLGAAIVWRATRTQPHESDKSNA